MDDYLTSIARQAKGLSEHLNPSIPPMYAAQIPEESQIANAESDRGEETGYGRIRDTKSMEPSAEGISSLSVIASPSSRANRETVEGTVCASLRRRAK